MSKIIYPLLCILSLLFSNVAAADVEEWQWIEWEMMDVVIELEGKPAVRGSLEGSDATSATVKLLDGTAHRVERSDCVAMYRMDEHWASQKIGEDFRKAGRVMFYAGLVGLVAGPLSQCVVDACAGGPVLTIAGGSFMLLGRKNLRQYEEVEMLLSTAKTTALLELLRISEPVAADQPSRRR